MTIIERFTPPPPEFWEWVSAREVRDDAEGDVVEATRRLLGSGVDPSTCLPPRRRRRFRRL